MKIDVVYSTVHRPYACFDCRKSFKRPRVEFTTHRPLKRNEYETFHQRTDALRRDRRGHACPQCGGTTHFMGVDFKPPKTSDRKAWREVEAYIRSGKIYRHSWYCAKLPQIPGLGFHQGRDLVRAIRRAGLTLGDVPPMYIHQVPEFIRTVKLGRLRLKRSGVKTPGRGPARS